MLFTVESPCVIICRVAKPICIGLSKMGCYVKLEIKSPKAILY